MYQDKAIPTNKPSMSISLPKAVEAPKEKETPKEQSPLEKANQHEKNKK